ncbi:MAG: hypothetical protein IPN90_04490 [Elusimicrobia bacterium]|nr:hypothetical protein [Elusimicrobiota bacterium]
MPTAQFHRLTGYTPSGIESSMQNIETIQFRLQRMVKMLPVSAQELVGVGYTDPSAGRGDSQRQTSTH